MPRKPKPPLPPSEPIEVEIAGTIYRGTYRVQSRVVTVQFGNQKNSTQVGGGTPESVARQLLREMVEK